MWKTYWMLLLIACCTSFVIAYYYHYHCHYYKFTNITCRIVDQIRFLFKSYTLVFYLRNRRALLFHSKREEIWEFYGHFNFYFWLSRIFSKAWAVFHSIYLVLVTEPNSFMSIGCLVFFFFSLFTNWTFTWCA